MLSFIPDYLLFQDILVNYQKDFLQGSLSDKFSWIVLTHTMLTILIWTRLVHVRGHSVTWCNCLILCLRCIANILFNNFAKVKNNTIAVQRGNKRRKLSTLTKWAFWQNLTPPEIYNLCVDNLNDHIIDSWLNCVVEISTISSYPANVFDILLS